MALAKLLPELHRSTLDRFGFALQLRALDVELLRFALARQANDDLQAVDLDVQHLLDGQAIGA